VRELLIDDYVLATASKHELRTWEREPLLSPAGQLLFGIRCYRDVEHCRTVMTAPQAVFDMLRERPVWRTSLVVERT